MLAICAALAWETRPAVRALNTVRRTPIDGVPVWQGRWGDRPALVFRTGIGSAHAAATARIVMDRFPVTALVNTGCAGGLAPELTVGAVVIPDRLVAAAADDVHAFATDANWTATLRVAASAAGLAYSGAPLLTVNAALESTAAKRAAHERFQAAAVEMEGGAIAALAAHRAIPFASARVILDDAATDLPPVAGMLAPDGSLRPVAAALRVLGQPSQLPALMRLSAARRQAEDRLTALFRAFLRDDHASRTPSKCPAP